MSDLPWLTLAGEVAAAVALGAVLFALAAPALAGAERPAAALLPAVPRGWMLAAMAGIDLALALVLAGYYHTGAADILRTLLACSILWPCAWVDGQVFLIPNRVVFTGGACALLLVGGEILLAPGQARYLLVRTAAAAVALTAAALLCRLISPKAVGGGDVKLLAVLGLCMGMDLVWGAVFVSLLLMFFFCIFLLATKKAARTDSVPFAPFLLAGTLAAAFLTGI